MSESKMFKIDMNDPTAVLPDDEIDINPEGDAFSGPPPVPDGEHVAALSLSQQGVQGGKTEQGTDYVMVNIEARVQAPGEKFDNFPVFDSASTLVSENSGTCRIAGILTALGAHVPSRIGKGELVRLLVKELEAKPQVKVTTKWEGYCDVCPGKKEGKVGRVVVRGQRNFPEGKHTMKCPNCGNDIAAKARITKYAAK